jgi:histidinol-phosphate aminotransferase
MSSTADARRAEPIRLRPTIRDIQLYKPGKRVVAAAGGPRIALVASNETAFEPLPGVVDAAQAVLPTCARYPDPFVAALTGAIAAHHGVAPERVLTGSGSMTLFHQAVLSTTAEGEEIVFAWPSFEGYPLLCAIAGARPVRVPLVDGRHDLEAMREAVTERTRLVFVCNPNNPTGTLLQDAELRAFVAGLPDDVLVVIDEAYLDFAGDGAPLGGMGLLEEHPNVVAMRTFSKAYGLAGLRVGYCVAHPEVIDGIRRSHLPFNVNAVAQAAAVASLGAQVALRHRLAEVAREREQLIGAARDAGYPVAPSFGNFVWLAVGEQAADLAARLETHGVIARALPPFGVRITIGTPEDNEQVAAALRAV